MAIREPRSSLRHAYEDGQIDRDSFEPAYFQLAALLRRQIATGALRPGDRLPPEAELRQQHDVSPTTVRRAINMLLDEGLVTTARGRGTFVKPLGLGAAVFGLAALEELFTSKETTVEFLSARTIRATPRISEALHAPIDARVITLRRLLSHRGEPVAFHREYMVLDIRRPIVEAEIGVTSLQGLFEGRGQTMFRRGSLRIQTTTLTEDESRLLLAPCGSAAFRIQHTFYDFAEQPVSWGWFIVRGDRLAFEATLGAQT